VLLIRLNESRLASKHIFAQDIQQIVQLYEKNRPKSGVPFSGGWLAKCLYEKIDFQIWMVEVVVGVLVTSQSVEFEC
jgi:hypothetical protein